MQITNLIILIGY